MSLTRLTLTIGFSLASLFGQDAGKDPLLGWMDQIAQQQLSRLRL